MSPSPGKGKVQQSWTRRQQHRLEGTGWQEPSASSTGSWHPLAEVARRAAHRAAFEQHQQAPAPMIDLTVYDDEEGGSRHQYPDCPWALCNKRRGRGTGAALMYSCMGSTPSGTACSYTAGQCRSVCNNLAQSRAFLSSFGFFFTGVVSMTCSPLCFLGGRAEPVAAVFIVTVARNAALLWSKVIVLTHEGASAEETIPYLAHVFWPAPPVTLFGRCGPAEPSIKKEACVYHGWKDCLRAKQGTCS